MEVVYERCCGLDVHKKTVVACVLVGQDDGSVRRTVRTFDTHTDGLYGLSAWLHTETITQVVIESTGVYWWPVYNILDEEGFTLTLVNAQHTKAIPGRKTDVADSAWLADLLRHGLVRGSFIPPAQIRVLRELTRYRKSLVQERAQEANRLHKVLESANIKIAAVLTDILGASGRAMLAALVQGEDDPEVIAQLAHGRLHAKMEPLVRALKGCVKPHHRVLITASLHHVRAIDEIIAQIDESIAEALAPFRDAVALLTTIPGVSETAAATVIAEIGVDMAQFPSSKNLASWAGLCPGNKRSGGRRLSGATTHGSPWLRAVMTQIAWAAVRKKGTSFGAQFRRIVVRQGKQKALIAVAHRLLVVIYHILTTHVPYDELGEDYYHPHDIQRRAEQHIKRLRNLGFDVTVAPHQAA